MTDIFKIYDCYDDSIVYGTTNNSGWRLQKCTQYTVPEFQISISNARGSFTRHKKTMSKVLAFIDLVKYSRYTDACTIMPIPTTKKELITICKNESGVKRLINYMISIGLISIYNSKYRFTNNKKDNYCREYYYYIENEKLIKLYCELNGINKCKLEIIREIEEKEGNIGTLLFKREINGFSADQVRFNSKLQLLKPNNMKTEDFSNALEFQLRQNYPELSYYQHMCAEINEKYYADFPEFINKFSPTITYTRGQKAVHKIGIRATNSLCNLRKASAASDNAEGDSICREDILKEYGFNLHKDVKSSVPRITASINLGKWIPESIDIYELILKVYLRNKTGITETDIENYSALFLEKREAIKKMFMRSYFDSKENIGFRTRAKMRGEYNSIEVDNELQLFRESVIEAIGGITYDSEIFYHESCIYFDVLKQLLDEGYMCWICYDSFYAKKDGVTQEEFEKYTEQLIENKANEYIARWKNQPVAIAA